MPREKEDYRDTLADIYARFGTAQLIPLRQVSEFVGVDERTLKKDKAFPKKKIGGRWYVTASHLARFLC